jgi:hypothetical protein
MKPECTKLFMVEVNFADSVGIPYVEWFGMAGNYLAFSMDLLGSSLEDLFNYCGRKFTLKTTLLIADQMVAQF